jgi:hypothetical protein
MRMRRIILSSVFCLALPYFPTLSHNRHDFRKTLIERKNFLIFSTLLCETFIILSRIHRDAVTRVHRSCHILMELEFSRHILEKHSSIKFHEHPCRQT